MVIGGKSLFILGLIGDYIAFYSSLQTNRRLKLDLRAVIDINIIELEL